MNVPDSLHEENKKKTKKMFIQQVAEQKDHWG